LRSWVCKNIHSRLEKENGVAKAIECIYRDLEYARSIIKSSREPHPLDNVDSLSEPPHDIGNDEEFTRKLSEDWSMVEDEHGKEHSPGILSPLKRVSQGFSGLTNVLHPLKHTPDPTHH
jgi:hypothetical protein